MLLLIDAGNTSVKWAVAQANAAPSHWVAYGIAEHPHASSLAEGWEGYDITRVVVSNVAGKQVEAELQKMTSRVLGMKPVPLHWFASVPELAGVRNAYRNPSQLGCDRFAAAIGAHALFPRRPLVIATCGTATTVDALTADGVFLGGMILPGLQLMAKALAVNTAQLPLADQDVASGLFADNTLDAIANGCMAAQTGAIEKAVAEHGLQSGTANGTVECVLSGGAASRIAPRLAVPYVRVDNLVLTGLQIVAGLP